MNPPIQLLRKQPVTLQPLCITKLDSAASKHYVRPEDKNILQNLTERHGPPVGLPNSEQLPSTHSGTLPLSTKLSSQAQQARVLPGLKSATLISLGQLANDGCISILNDSKLHVIKEGEPILQGYRNPSDGLYDIALYAHPAHPNPKKTIMENNYLPPTLHCIRPSSTISLQKERKKVINKKVQQQSTSRKHHINYISDRLFHHHINIANIKNEKAMVILCKQQNCADLAQFLHACAGAPVASTWCRAIDNGHFITWPGLTTQLIKKHLPPSIPTAK